MSFATQQIQGHYVDANGNGVDQSTTIQFKQYIGDFNLATNIAYISIAIAGILGITSLALTYGLSELGAVLLAVLLGIGVIALRIKIFNHYAFSIGRVGVSPQGDVEWPGGWLRHTAVGQIVVQHSDGLGRGSKVVCISSTGEAHILGSGLPQARAEAIRRDIVRALRRATSDTAPHSGSDR